MGGRQFKFTPKVEDESESTQVKEVDRRNLNLILLGDVQCEQGGRTAFISFA